MALWTDQGGYLASLNLSKELRTALKPGLRFRQFCDIKDPEQQGAMHKGATFHKQTGGSKTVRYAGTSREVMSTTKVK